MKDAKSIRVHILDVLGGINKSEIKDMDDLTQKLESVIDKSFYRIEEWIIGKDISSEMVEKYRDPETNDIYCIVRYEKGKPSAYLLLKADWEIGKARIGG